MKLSVVILDSQGVDRLKRCVEAFCTQKAIEAVGQILVVDDGTQTDSADWIASRGAGEGGFALERVALDPAQASSPGAARNAAVAKAAGDLVLFTDDRCLPSPGMLAGHLTAQVRGGGTRSVIGRRTGLASLPVSLPLLALEDATDPSLVDRNPPTSEPGWLGYHTANVSTGRALLANHPFDERFETGRFTDLEFAYRLALTGHRFEYHSELVAWHDRTLDAAALRERYRAYGADVARMHQIHPGDRVAQALGVTAACRAQHIADSCVTFAANAVRELEIALEGVDPRSQTCDQAVGAREAMRILGDCYALLARAELTAGIRDHLGLSPLPTR